MPADDLSILFDSLTRVRLEARPFHIPPCIAMWRWMVMLIGRLAWIDEFRVGADRCVRPHMSALL